MQNNFGFIRGFMGIKCHTRTLVRCIVCGVSFPKPKKCIQQHCNGERHSRVLFKMKRNGISFENFEFHCRPCGTILDPNEAVAQHIASEYHDQWVQSIENATAGELIEYESYLTRESDHANCEVCKVDLECTAAAINNHTQILEHKRKTFDWLKSGNGMVYTKDGKVWCKVCDIHFDNNLTILFDHLHDDRNHMEWLMKMDDMIQDQGISIEPFLTIEEEMKVYCSKCDIRIYCTPPMVECHIQSECHQYRFYP